jgi:hypothetical protein
MRKGSFHRRFICRAVLALGLGLLLAGCGQTLVPGAGQGTLNGLVVAGPICPVESKTNPCPDRPVPNREVKIETSSGAVVATATTDAQGHFSVVLAPGSYVVRVTIVRGQIGMRQASPGNVSVLANQPVSVTIELDTGIR